MKNIKNTKSYIMFIGSVLIFGSIGIFRRYIPLSSATLACVRGFLGAIFLIIFVKLKGRKLIHGIGIKKLLLLALGGIIMSANWIFLFEAFNHTTVATATLCYYMEPTIILLLSPMVFKEKLTLKKIICILLSIVGMLFVSGIFTAEGQESDVLGIVFGLSAAAMYSGLVIINKKVQIEDSYEKTIIELASAAIFLIPYLLITEDFSGIEFNWLTILMVIIVGVVHTGIGFAMYFGSMNMLKAQSVAVLSYMDPVSALILSAIFLGERMTVYGVVGAVLIIGAALLCELELPKLKKQENG